MQALTGLTALKDLPEDVFAETIQESFVTKLSDGTQVLMHVCLYFRGFLHGLSCL